MDNAESGDTIRITADVKDPIDLIQGELYLACSVTIQSVPSRTATIDAGQIRCQESHSICRD